VVTGGTRGIDGGAVERLAAEGATVVACARTTPQTSLPTGVTFLTVDVTDEESIASVVVETVRLHGRLDVVVANAGTGGIDQWPDEPTANWNGILELNLNGTMFTCRAAWPHLTATAGAIVVVSSLSAVMGIGRNELDQMGGFQPSPSWPPTRLNSSPEPYSTSTAAPSPSCNQQLRKEISAEPVRRLSDPSFGGPDRPSRVG
jgi:NAD(P)-dependent dehydrogenase (short-subunit alcohol dehydrogenase family)